VLLEYDFMWKIIS